MPLHNLPYAVLLRVKKALSLSTFEEIQKGEERLKICRVCPKIKVVKQFGTEVELCSLCSCILELKTLVPTEHCKDNKW